MTTSINYDNAVQELYVTYFGRPADPGGLSNFAAALAAAGAPADLVGLYNAYGSNPSVKGLVDSFGTSSESVKLYGDTSTQSGVQAFVNDVFQNLFGRSANAEGLSFWSNAILSGSVTQGDAALAIAAGAAQNTTDQGMLDAKAVANKVSVASQFTVDLLTQQQIAAYSGAAAAAAARTLLDAVSGTTDPSAFAQAIGSTIYNITNPTGSLSYYLTPGIDHLSATASGAAFEAVLDNAAGVAAGGAASTFNAGDSLVGVAGTNSLVLNDVGVGGYFALPSGLTLTNITLLQLQTSQSVYDPSVSNGAVDLSKSGFTTVEIWGAPGTNAVKVAPGALLSFSPSRGSVTTYGGATVEVTGDGSLQNEYAPANAIYGDGSTKSVEINSGWNYLVQDANFGTGKSNSISSVTAQANYGNININSDALTTLVAANEGLSNVITINAAAGARSLAISLDGDTGLTIVDRTATVVSIDTVSQANSYTNPVSSNLNLQFAAAQSVNIDASLGMNATTLYAPDASELSFDGSGYVTFASVTLHDGAHIDASGSNTAIAMSLHGSVSFTGGRGSDTITIDSAPAGPITGGVSSSNEIVLDNLGSVSASTLAQISKFATLGIAGSTSGTFDLSAMAGISVLDFHGASGTDTFTNVTQSTQVNITNGGSLNLSLQMADSHGYYNAMIVNIGGTGTTNFGIAQLTVGDAGGHGVDALDLAAVYGQHGVSYTFGGLSDIGLEDLGLTGYDAININTPIVDSSSLLSINSSAGNSGNYVAGVNDFNLTSLTLAGGVGLQLGTLTTGQYTLAITDTNNAGVSMSGISDAQLKTANFTNSSTATLQVTSGYMSLPALTELDLNGNVSMSVTRGIGQAGIAINGATDNANVSFNDNGAQLGAGNTDSVTLGNGSHTIWLGSGQAGSTETITLGDGSFNVQTGTQGAFNLSAGTGSGLNMVNIDSAPSSVNITLGNGQNQILWYGSPSANISFGSGANSLTGGSTGTSGQVSFAAHTASDTVTVGALGTNVDLTHILTIVGLNNAGADAIMFMDSYRDYVSLVGVQQVVAAAVSGDPGQLASWVAAAVGQGGLVPQSAGGVSWFQFGGNTYLVETPSANDAGVVSANDAVVELTGTSYTFGHVVTGLELQLKG